MIIWNEPPKNIMPIALNQMHGTSNLLEVMLTGKLSRRDYETLDPMVEEMVREHGKIRVLLEMSDFHGWELGAAWEDTKFTFRHFNDISRIAMVGDRTWEKGMSTFCKAFTKAEIRYFD